MTGKTRPIILMSQAAAVLVMIGLWVGDIIPWYVAVILVIGEGIATGVLMMVSARAATTAGTSSDSNLQERVDEEGA
jgi:Na+/phosphate symporter